MLQLALNWLRRSFRDACVGGVQDALDELDGKPPQADAGGLRERIAALTSKAHTDTSGEDADGEKLKAGRNGRANRQTSVN